MADARKIAVNALMAIDKDGAYSNIAVDNAIKSAYMVGADAALCSALVYGVLDRRNALDHIITACSSRPINKLSLYVLEVLRISVLQLTVMDKIPPFAAINEAVRIIKKSKDHYAAGYVNAVLRSVQRSVPLLPDGDDLKSLNVTLSCDKSIIQRVVADYGIEKARQILAAPESVQPVFLRINSLRCTAEQLVKSLKEDSVEASFVDGMPSTLAVRGGLERTAAYKSGWFHVQDLSCQLACEALCPGRDMRVLDVCAAPGGKSFTLAGMMKGTGAVVAGDIHPHRVNLIQKGVARLGYDNVVARIGDATVYDSELGEFDRVLCDVPCSGVGVIRRKPDIRYKSAEDFDSLPELQYTILDTSSKYVKPGGVIVYSTCTIFKAENEAVFSRFIDNHSDFEPVPFDNGRCVCTLLPGEAGDGFFFARARRKG